MALEDKDIFSAIFAKHSDKPIEFIMEQYEKAKRINSEIEKRFCLDTDVDNETVVVEAVEVPVEAAPKKRHTKKSIKFDPATAITRDSILCCICGKEYKSLTAKHLKAHDITVEEYKKLCGYPESQSLMCEELLDRSRQIIKHAQNARQTKDSAAKEENA